MPALDMRQIHLWAFLQGIGFFPGGWRHPLAKPEAVFERSYYQRLAKMTDDARFDAIVFGDQLQGRDAAGRTPGRLAAPTLDPFTLLAVMADASAHVGLVATVSTTYAEPAEVAAKFAALNYVSNGRAGWNIVTTAHPTSPWNFGESELLDKSLRYQRAKAFVDAAEHFWSNAAGSRTIGSTSLALSTCQPRRSNARCWCRQVNRRTGGILRRAPRKPSSAPPRRSRPARTIATTCVLAPPRSVAIRTTS